ncbi:MAG: monovalent cation/H(+) antiporter subunit G [Desertimonas sp.]
MIAELIALAGALLMLVAAIGVTRFEDALEQMHALTKASTVGLGLVVVGMSFLLGTANDVTSALAAAALYIGTVPIGASLLGRATHLADRRRRGAAPGPARHDPGVGRMPNHR